MGAVASRRCWTAVRSETKELKGGNEANAVSAVTLKAQMNNAKREETLAFLFILSRRTKTTNRVLSKLYLCNLSRWAYF